MKDKIWKIFLALGLLVGTLAKIWWVVGKGYRPSLDELIVISVSRQPWKQMIDSLLVEPHPPGFYLLIRLLGRADIATMRLTTIALGLLILVVGLLCAWRNKIIEKFDLGWGIVWLVCSYGFLYTTMQLKQDVLSIPILVVMFLIFVGLVGDKDKSRQRKYWWWLTASEWVLLALGYGAAINGGLMWLIAGLRLWKERGIKLILSAQLIIWVVYGFTWVSRQWINNRSRFMWVKGFHNNPIEALLNNYVGQIETGQLFLLAILILVLVGIILGGLYYHELGNDRKVTKYLVILIGTIGTINYFMYWFIRVRYVLFWFFLVGILTSWIVKRFLGNKTSLMATVSVVVLVTGLWRVTRDLNLEQTINQQILTKIEELSQHQPTGLVSNGFFTPFVLKMRGNLSPEQIPVHPFHPGLFANKQVFDRELLLLDGDYDTSQDKNLASLMAQNNLTRYIYFYYYFSDMAYYYYDPNKLVLDLMRHKCLLKKETAVGKVGEMYLFTQCDFVDNGAS